jgi:glycosyltransferase involved in cell wall biosynthesis
MRILHIGKFYPPDPGGMERYLADLAEAQRAAGHEVLVLVHSGSLSGTQGDPPWIVRSRVWFRLLFAPVSPAFPWHLYRAIKRHRPDLLHIHVPNPSAFWALLLPAARALPWVVQWQSDVEPSPFRRALRLAYPHYRIFERALLERSAAIVVATREYLQSSAALAPWRDQCRVIPLGVDPGRLKPVAADACTGLWQTGHIRLLAVGRLTYYKGFETLIRAAAALDRAELVIIGEGEERRHLEGVYREYGSPPWIRLVGHVDDDLCHRYMASCDVFCLPSRERTESFGLVLLEAMRYGKPLVAGSIPGSGVNWVVRHDDNGLLVPPEETDAWCDTLRSLAVDSALRQRLGAAGRRRFQNEMSMDRVQSAVDNLYTSLLAAEREAPLDRDRPLVVIPARNEALTIGTVIDQVKAVIDLPVVVVDDGSSDGTADIAARHGATVLRPPLSQGAWGAMQTGIRYAVAHGFRGVVTMDADGQHEPAYLQQLLLAADEADVVIGAFPARGSTLRHVAWAYFRLLTGFRFEDLTSGFRYYNRAACQLLANEEATLLDYQDIGVLLLLHKAGFRVREIPVTMNARQVGISRVFDSWLTVTRYMVETTLLCLARWRVGARRR